MEKLSGVLNAEDVMEIEELTQEQLTPELEVIEECANVKAVFPDTDDICRVPRRDALKTRECDLMTVRPFRLISPTDCEGKGRRIAHQFPSIKWHISDTGIITAYEIDKKVYPACERRQYYDPKTGSYVPPATAKVIDSNDVFFNVKRNLPLNCLSPVVKDQSKRLDMFEDSVYKAFERFVKISEQLHSTGLENLKKFFPTIYRCLEETVDAMIGKEDKSKRLFVELHFLLRGSEWARRSMDKVPDGPAEGTYPILGDDRKVVELFSKVSKLFINIVRVIFCL